MRRHPPIRQFNTAVDRAAASRYHPEWGESFDLWLGTGADAASLSGAPLPPSGGAAGGGGAATHHHHQHHHHRHHTSGGGRARADSDVAALALASFGTREVLTVQLHDASWKDSLGEVAIPLSEVTH